MCVPCMHVCGCMFQKQIQWTEVRDSAFLYDVNIRTAAGDMYGVAVKHSDGQSGPIHWAKCLYNIAERLYFSYYVMFTSALCMQSLDSCKLQVRLMICQ